MFKSIKSKMILLYTTIILVTFGIVFIIFSTFSEDYYYTRKTRVMKEAFQRLSKTDLSGLSRKDNVIVTYEEQRLRFIIADENFNKVYVSGNMKPNDVVSDAKIENKIIKKVDKYKENFTTKVANTRIVGRGIISQDGHKYYVYIYETKTGIKIHFSYMNLFFRVICIIALVVSIGLSCVISDRITKPIKQIERNTKNAINNKFNVNLDEKQGFKELESLSHSINVMMEQIRTQIESLEKELEKKILVEEGRRQFINNVSHEMKTPLAIISSQVQMLELIQDSEKRNEYCRSIIDETTNMSEMINEMIVIYSMENNNETMDLAKTDIACLVSESCERYANLFEGNDITLHEEYEKDCLAEVNARYLSQAVDNYITNSVKHSIRDGHVYVRVMKNDFFIRIEVENQGPPVPDADKDRIWSKFYRGDVSETLNGQKGSGLGLYLVKSIVELHEGNYGYKNLKKGVLFYIEIPR